VIHPCYRFFMYAARVHRDLHSFPTRRSSDLEDRLGARGDGAVEGRRVLGVGPHHVPAEALERIVELVDRAAIQLAGGDELVARLDRKSTRLNSSHVKISYAVFCLKKKRKQKN